MLRIRLSRYKSAIPASFLLLAFSCTPKPQVTIENLKESIVCEMNASIKYHAFAEQASEEGYRNVSNFFKALSSSELIHAERQMEVLKSYSVSFKPEVIEPQDVKVGSTWQNLRALLDEEEYNHQTKFPVFVSVAVDEGCSHSERTFGHSGKTAQSNVRYARRVIKAIEQDGSDWNVVNSWSVCPHCGGVYVTVNLDENCQYCHMAGSAFDLYQ